MRIGNPVWVCLRCPMDKRMEMETIGDISQAVILTSTLILAVRVLVIDIYEEYAEIIAYWVKDWKWS